MSKFKAVIFDLGGVILPQPQKSIALYAKKLGLPSRFLPELFLHNAPSNAFCRLERGELTIGEFYSVFESEAKTKSKNEAIVLPKEFSAKALFNSFSHSRDTSSLVNQAMLSASTLLRSSGILTCVLTNNWIEDDPEIKVVAAKFMVILKQFFNEVVESARIGIRKPTPDIYKHTCSQLGVSPQECVFLDDIGQNLKAAKALGITTVLVTDPIEALKELETITCVKLLTDAKLVYPAACDPSKVAHGFVETEPGVKIHFVENGSGPAVILLHGFPDGWYGWRHQLPALAAAGYRAIALDGRGYGGSSSPSKIEDYSHQELCQDVITLMDRLSIGTATVVGHDWGGSLAWALALKYPDRLTGVCGVNTPFFRVNPKQNPLVSMTKNPGVFDYQLYFQTPGVAEEEFETDVRRAVNLFFQGFSSRKNFKDQKVNVSPSNVRERGGMFVGLPNIPRSSFLSAQDLDYYVEGFERNGFRGPLNWYRNYEANWKWLCAIAHRKVEIPALMITASHDVVLKPIYTMGMEKYVLNLQRYQVENCGHWTPQEKPQELNDGLIKWLDQLHRPVSSKL